MDGDNELDVALRMAAARERERQRVLNRAQRMMFDEAGIEPGVEARGAKDNEGLIAVMKRRHLRKEERDRLHKPGSDWLDTPRGDACYSATTLPIEDIVKKFAVN